MACSKAQSVWGSTAASYSSLMASSSSSTTQLFLGVKQRCSVAVSLESSSSSKSDSSCCCSYSSVDGNGLRRLITEKSVKEAISVDGFFRVVGKDGSFARVERRSYGDKIPTGSSQIEKAPLWRKMMFVSNKIKSIILLNVITFVYASNIPVVKEVEAVMDPAAFSAVRFVVSCIPFLPFVFRAREDVKIRNAGIELGIWVSLGYLVEALGLLTSDAGRASFISLFTVIIVPVLDGMLGAFIPARTWFGVLISILGVSMLECSGSPPNVGDFLNFLSAIFFGIHMLRTEQISRCTKKENYLALLGYEILVVAVLSTLWYLIGEWLDGAQDFDQSQWTLTGLWYQIIEFPWIPAFYTGIFSTGLCLWIEMSAMRHVSATETAIIYGLEPVWGAGFAWFLLGERWGTVGWIGASLVLCGSLTVQMFGSSPSKKETEKGEGNESIEFLSAMEKQKLKNGLSASPIVVRSREDTKDLL